MRDVKNQLYKTAQFADSNSNEKWHEYRTFKNEYKRYVKRSMNQIKEN